MGNYYSSYHKNAFDKQLQTFEKNEKTESLSKEISDVKNQTETSELKNIIPKIKNSLDGLNSRIETKEERTSELEDGTI